VYLVRYLGAVTFGKYAFAFAFTSLFVILSDLGLSVLSIREIARDTSKAGEYLTNISITKFVLSLITIVLIIVTINLMHYPQDTILAVYIVGGATVFTSLTSFFRSIFRAFERMEYEAITRIVERILIFGSVLPVLFLGYGLIEVVSAMLIAHAFIFIFTLAIIIKKFTRPVLSFDFSLCKSLIKAALPFGLASVFNVIYFQTDTVMLSIMKGDAVVGWYNAAYRLVMGMLFIPSAFVGALYPVLSRYFTSSKDSLMVVYEKSFKFLLMLAIPLGIGTTLLADRIIIFLYGENFAPSIIALQILIWVASILFIYSIVGYTLASINKQLVDTRITAVSALLNVGLNLLLIPTYSYVGAGVASIASQVFVFTCEFSYLQKNGYGFKVSKVVLKPLCAGAIMGLFIYSIRVMHINLFVIISGAIVIYVASLYVLKAFDETEMEMMKAMFKNEVSVKLLQKMGRS
ncbi:flippase, partial [candidate division WOR-3 bacterium]|nr:flippase [candidate division WOR-3 bacterium]